MNTYVPVNEDELEELVETATLMAQELEDIITEAEEAGCDNPFPEIRALLNDWESIFKRVF